ncbi:MAG: hypothetical protein CMB77_02445 [Euryarchaeota archaeon]|nr:hypothetical protein [Euryarchaeota archaeon]
MDIRAFQRQWATHTGGEVMERRIRLLLFGCLVVLATGAAFFVRSPEVSISVTEITDDPSEFAAHKIAVRGVVENESLDEVERGFWLGDNDAVIYVDYGATTLSDAFAEGRTILVRGVLEQRDSGWVLAAEEIQVGCPSKYEAEVK